MLKYPIPIGVDDLFPLAPSLFFLKVVDFGSIAIVANVQGMAVK